MSDPEIPPVAAASPAVPAVTTSPPSLAPSSPGATPWALHSFGYRAGLPRTKTFSGGLTFETAKKLVVVSLVHEPVGSPGVVLISPIGPARAVVSVISDAPIVSRRHVVSAVSVNIDGVHGGTVSFMPSDDVSADRSHSIILGDPTLFTFDQQERLAVRNAIWTIEDKFLSGELTRQTIPGLSRELLLGSDQTHRIPDRGVYPEVVRQLTGALRADSWGYLWKWKKPPAPEDGALIVASRQMTQSMSMHLRALTETMSRACGAVPVPRGYVGGDEVLEATAFAIVAMRRGVPVEKVARVVAHAIREYGKTPAPHRPRNPRPRRRQRPTPRVRR